MSTKKNQVKKQTQAKSPTLENIAFQWLEELKPIRKKSTIVKYMGQLKNYIIPAFGNLKLNEISNENIIFFQQKAFDGRTARPKTLAQDRFGHCFENEKYSPFCVASRLYGKPL